MSRNHIHFAPGMPKDNGVVSGMRGSCDIYIEIDMFAAIKDGVSFFISSNNVILTEGVNGVLDSKYFKSVTKKDGGELVWGKNGWKVFYVNICLDASVEVWFDY